MLMFAHPMPCLSPLQGFTFPTMLAAGASPGQAQLLQAAPRVRGIAMLDAQVGCVHSGLVLTCCSACSNHAGNLAIVVAGCFPTVSLPCLSLMPAALPLTHKHQPHTPCRSLCRRCRWTDGQALLRCPQA